MESHADAGGQALELSITGMTCDGCARTLQRVLARVPGVARVEVDRPAGRARVTGSAPLEQLVAAVRGAGYGVQGPGAPPGAA